MDPLTITLTLDLDREIGSRYVDRIGGYDSDGTPYEAEGPHRAESVAEVVVDQASRLVAAGVDPEARKDLHTRIRSIRDEVIRAQVEPLIVEALTGPIAQTNHFGEVQLGKPPTTLREIIVEQATQQLRAPQANNGMRDRQPTLVERIIAEQITKVIGKELAEAVAAAKALVVAQVNASAADLLSKAVADGLRK